MKRKIKAIGHIAVGGLALGAMSSANASMGGTNLVGSLSSGVGAMLPATGSLLGAGLAIDSAMMMIPKKKRR